MEVQIRPGSWNELSELIALQTLSLETLCRKDYDFSQISALVESQSRARGGYETLFVAEADSKIVGFATLMNGAAQIGAIYVHPDWTRQGIATHLLAAVEQEAIPRRCRVLRVVSSLTAVPFYQSQGYVAPPRSYGLMTLSKVQVPCQVLEKRLIPPNPAIAWMYRYRIVLMLGLLGLLGLGVGLNRLQPEDQDRPPQFNPSTSLLQ